MLRRFTTSANQLTPDLIARIAAIKQSRQPPARFKQAWWETQLSLTGLSKHQIPPPSILAEHLGQSLPPHRPSTAKLTPAIIEKIADIRLTECPSNQYSDDWWVHCLKYRGVPESDIPHSSVIIRHLDMLGPYVRQQTNAEITPTISALIDELNAKEFLKRGYDDRWLVKRLIRKGIPPSEIPNPSVLAGYLNIPIKNSSEKQPIESREFYTEKTTQLIQDYFSPHIRTAKNKLLPCPFQGSKITNFVLESEADTETVKKWFLDTSNKGGYQYILKAPKYEAKLLCKHQPYPENPYFKPKPPLSNVTKTEIFELYKNDPEKYTPRVLGEGFGISIARVEAILRLKSLEKDMIDNGKAVETDLSENMDKLLNSKTLTPNFLAKPNHTYEKLRPLETSGSLKPFFRMVREEETFTPDDAAKLLQKEPFENIKIRLDRAASKAFSSTAPEETALKESLVVKEDFGDVENKRSNVEFFIVDSGTKDMLVREASGVLRNADKRERWVKKYSKPEYGVHRW